MGGLSIMAVGDDDQNIYAFRGANVEFIRKFQKDYPAKVVYLVENYRSSKHIIDAANQLIRHNVDRMKTEHPIRINRERDPNLPGGRWELLDPVSKGRVQVIAVRNRYHQAECVKAELERLKGLSPDLTWDDCAILARSRNVPVARPLAAGASRAARENPPREQPAACTVCASSRPSGGRFPKSRAKTAGLPNCWPWSTSSAPATTASPWWRMLEGFVKALVDETADATLPVGWAIDSFYDYVAEQRREKFLGSGVFLGTIHSTKGMEFPHVVILDGGWGVPSDDKQTEEERRTLYVGMTRARETLALMMSEERPNPLLRDLKGGNLLLRKGAARSGMPGGAAFRQYEVLGLDDVYLDYAGGFHQRDPIHVHLSRIQAGDKVFLTADNPGINICDKEGVCVGRLSHGASAKWEDKLELVSEVRVVAMIKRDSLDSQEGFRDRVKADKWEVPVLEVVFTYESLEGQARLRVLSWKNLKH